MKGTLWERGYKEREEKLNIGANKNAIKDIRLA